MVESIPRRGRLEDPEPGKDQTINAKTLLKASVTILLLAGLAYQMDLAKFRDALAAASPLILLPAVAVQIGSAFLSVARWRSILRNFDIDIPFLDLTKICFIGSFFNLFLPSSIGGDFFRAFYLSRQKKRGMSTTLTTTMLERSGGLCALLAIGLVSALSHRLTVHGVGLLYVFIGLAGVYLLANLALFNPRIHAWINRALERFHLEDIENKMDLVYRGLNSLIRNRRSIFVVLSLSLAIQLASVAIVWIAAQALAIEAPFGTFLVFIPLINLSIMVPLTINGFGLREGLYFLLFTTIGLQQEKAVALSLLNAAVVMLAALPGGVVYSLFKKEEHYDEAVAKADGSA